MYEDPNVSDREIVVRLRYASDDQHDAEMRTALVEAVQAAADAQGCDMEIAEEVA